MSRQKKKIKPCDEFRTNNRDSRRHPVYIFAQEGNDFIYFTITHASSFKNVLNVKFITNPNSSDERDTYFVPIAKRLHRNNFGRVKENWVLSDIDYENMMEYYEIPKTK